jgi:hypothetical protein
MMPTASSWGNSSYAMRSLSRSERRALANKGLSVVSMVWQILCFDDGVPFLLLMMAGKAPTRVRIVGEMEQRAETSFERGLLAA